MNKELLKKIDSFSRRNMVELMAANFLSLTYASKAFAARKSKSAKTAGRRSGGSSGSSGPGKAKSLVYIFAGGGMSHVDSFDIKEANKQANNNSEPIKTNVSGIRVGKYFAGMAKHMDRIALVNSMQHTQGIHHFANYLSRTAYSRSATIMHPEIGGWISKHKDRRSGDIPPFIKLGGGPLGNGFFPGEFGALPIGDAKAGIKNVRMPGGVSASQFKNRLDLTNALNQEFDKTLSNTMTKDYHKAYEDSVKLMNSKDLEVFNLAKESAQTKKLYGENKFGYSCLLARRLVEQGVNCVTLGHGGWDDHGAIYESYGDRSKQLDQGIAALMTDLGSRGLLDSTLVVLMTEFGRDAKINGHGGRGHNPRGYTTVLAGGGIQGGQQYGKTDAQGQSAVDKIVSPGDIHATIGYAMGMNTDYVEMSPTGRPFKLGNKGKPITELF